MSGPERLDLGAAVERFAPDGSTVYLGNFGAQLFAVGGEMIRRGRRGIHAVLGSGGILMDQLLGAGVLAEATFGHCWSPVGPAPAHNFRRACEGGAAVRLNEVTLGMLASALRAAAWGVPFMPVADLGGTVYETELAGASRPARLDSPFGRALVVPALAPDVAFVHVDVADELGNGLLRGPAAEAPLAAAAAAATVLVAEELVEGDAAARADPAACAVPGALVAAVVERPGAVRPDGAAGRYQRDVAAYAEYAAAAASEAGFAAWLRRHVLEPS